MKIHELLSDASKWTTEVEARDKHGVPIVGSSENAVCWCLWGAAVKCYVRYTVNFLRVTDAITERVGHVSTYNDAPERTFAEVYNLVKELDV